MRVRGLLITTAIASSILGAIAAYLVLSVPNDIQAGALLKEARRSIEKQQNDEARKALARVIQQYPRTDAAAAASVALAELQNQERVKLGSQIETIRKENTLQTQMLARQQKAIDELTAKVNAPPKIAPPPAPKPAAKKAPAKKPAKRPARTPARRRR